jgi:hypothetical protein
MIRSELRMTRFNHIVFGGISDIDSDLIYIVVTLIIIIIIKFNSKMITKHSDD